jgi:two-component system, sensor histidine kinase and response regulator
MLMPEPHRNTHDSYLGHYGRTGSAHIIGLAREVEGLHKNGEPITLDLVVTEYSVKSERFFVGTLHDSRERMRFIAELIRARADAEQAGRAKANFLAAMSHEIRPPMNGVIGMIDVLHQSSLRGDQVEMVNLIRESALSLLTVIDDILDLSKIEAGRLEIESLPMSVAAVVERVCGLLDQLDQLAMRKGVELTLFTDPAISSEVLGDAVRLSLVLINLVNNAIKFSSGQQRQGKVSLRAVLAERGTARETVEFHVTDNGIGMDGETLSRLFSPFVQADTSTTRRFGGTGLGLVIARNLSKLMAGDITVRSVPGEGSRFTFRLAFVPLPAKPDDAVAACRLAGLSCLVVGDPDGLAGDIATYLAHAGAKVEQAANLAASVAPTAACLPGPLWVWIIDAADKVPASDALRATARGRHESGCLDARFVVIGRGTRRQPRVLNTGHVTVDANPLNRATLLKAVAIASGRARPEEAAPQAGKKDAACRPVSRQEALRQNRLILVAEDNETNQKVILHQFALLGYAADVADDGFQALQKWRSGDYALLITDVHMPELDGYQLTAAIRAEENASRHIPIIALTANALSSEAERCRAAGMDEYLSKPIQLAALKATLEKFLPNRRFSPASRPVDVTVLKELVGDDPAIVHAFLQEFRVSAAKIGTDLRAACSLADAALARAAAHKLKSAARAVGALTLGMLCEHIEETGNAGRPDELIALLLRCETEMASVEQYLAAVGSQKETAIHPAGELPQAIDL